MDSISLMKVEAAASTSMLTILKQKTDFASMMLVISSLELPSLVARLFSVSVPRFTNRSFRLESEGGNTVKKLDSG